MQPQNIPLPPNNQTPPPVVPQVAPLGQMTPPQNQESEMNPDHEAMLLIAQQFLELKKEVENMKNEQGSFSKKEEVQDIGNKHSEMDKGIDARIDARIDAQINDRIKTIVQSEVKNEIKSEIKKIHDDIIETVNG